MEDGDEPPDRQKDSELTRKVNDTRRVILLPTKGEKAVCNPATLDFHFIYRVRKPANNGYREKSVLKCQKLETPYRLDGNPKTVLYPQTKYEQDGIEDARLSKLENGLYGITYVAFNEDEQNGSTSIALATTDDFKKIKREGIIGPRIRFEDAIKLVGGPDSYYGEKLFKELREIQKKHGDINPFVMDKDASLKFDKKTKEYILFHRVDPGIQIARAKNISCFQNQEFWRDQFTRLEENTILYPGTEDSSEDWASEKVGLGGTPRSIEGRLICHIHGVQKETEDRRETYTYKGTFAELDPKTYKIISILRNPLLCPGGDYFFEELSDEVNIRKYVNFPTDWIVDPKNSKVLWSYSGENDFAIETRSTSLPWLLKELSHRHNKIDNWQDGIA